MTEIKPEIEYSDFEKIDLRIGEILEAVDIVESKKLLKLTVDIGIETRQIVAGIKEHYKCEDLIGKQIVLLANLKLKKLMGIESKGMLLTADNNGVPIILTSLEETQIGGTIK